MSLYKLVLKNVLKNKFRTLLIALSVFVSFFIFGLVFSLGDWLSGRLASGQYSERLVIENRYQLPLKWSILEHLQNIEGVDSESVTGNTVLGAYLQDPEKKFFQRAVNAPAFLKLEEKYLTFNEDEVANWKKDRRGALIGRALAEKFGFKKGDTISLMSSSQVRKDGEPWVFNIYGIFDPKEAGIKTRFMVFHDQYLIEGVGDYQDVFWCELNVKKGYDPNSVAKQIDDAFKTSSMATSTQVLASITNRIASQAGDFYLMAEIIIAASFFTLFMVVGSSVFRAIKERSIDIAVLKTLGFRKATLSKLVYKETLLLVLIGYIPAEILLMLIEKIPYVKITFPGLFVPMHVVLYSFVAMIVFVFLISVYPVHLIGRKSIVGSLRGA